MLIQRADKSVLYLRSNWDLSLVYLNLIYPLPGLTQVRRTEVRETEHMYQFWFYPTVFFKLASTLHPSSFSPVPSEPVQNFEHLSCF